MSNELGLRPVTPTIQNFSSYVQYVMSIPSLEAQEEKELLVDYKRYNNIESAQKLVMSQLKTVVRIAGGYKNYGLPTEDLVQEGNIGLMKAVKHYDIKQDVRLYSYALVWIKAEIQNYVLKNWKMVKIATTKNFKKLFFNFRKTQKEMIDKGISKNETYKYISNKLNVTESEVKEIESYFVSEDSPILEEHMEDENLSYTPVALIEKTTPETIVQQNHDGDVYSKILDEGLNSLNQKQKEVIKYRFFEEEKKTHKEIAEILSISSERVRQIEVEALGKLKQLIVQ